MAVRQKLCETGWFYHAPAKPKQHEEVTDIPPASQIPGLSDLGPIPQEQMPIRGTIKDTDSKYIQLAKMGGRQDLLKFREPPPKSMEAKEYPRVDWFYLEDNAAEDTEQKKDINWEFTLPEYMVHQDRSNKKKKNVEYDPQRLPYGWDKKTVYEGAENPTDKTVKLQELTKLGYGVRQGKLNTSPPKKYNTPKPDRPKPKTGGPAPIGNEEKAPKPRNQPMGPLSYEKDRPNMSKLLSNGYAQDWREELDTWQSRQEQSKVHSREAQNTECYEKVAQEGMNASANKNRKPTKEVKIMVKPKGTQVEDKPMFKLSKFKNVPARTVHNRPSDAPTEQLVAQ